MFLGNPKPGQIWLSLTLPLSWRRWTWWGEDSQLWGLFLSSWPQMSTYPQYCLIILFLWSLHLTTPEMTIPYLLPRPQSLLSAFFSFSVNDLSSNSIWENSNSPKRSACTITAKSTHWYPNPLTSFLSERGNRLSPSQPTTLLVQWVASPLAQPRTLFLQLSIVSFKASSSTCPFL